MKALIIYHAHCLDGIMSATVVTKHLLDKKMCEAEDITLHAASYNDAPGTLLELQKLIKEEHIDRAFIVDFSYSVIELHNLDYYLPDGVLLIDHHEKAFKTLIGEGYVVKEDSKEQFNLHSSSADSKDGKSGVSIVLDNNESGASLCWKYLMNSPNMFSDVAEAGLPALIKYIKDYDLYRFTYPDTKTINKYLKTLDKTVPVFTALLEAFSGDWEFEQEAAIRGKMLLDYEESLENSILEQGITPITINGVQGLCVNAPYAFASSLGHKLAVLSKTFGAVWTQKSDGIVGFSLRSEGDLCNVNKLAGHMGGGGHKNAAGFSMDTPRFDKEQGITIWSNEAKEVDKI